MGTITRLAHEMFVSDEIGRLLDELSGFEASLPRDSDEASLIRVARQDSGKIQTSTAGARGGNRQSDSRRLPGVAHCAAGERTPSNVAPTSKKSSSSERRYIDCFPDVAEPYDALLDDYERGLDGGRSARRLNRLKEGLVPLVRLVKEQAEAVDDAPMRGHFSAEDQKRLSVRVIERSGFS